MTEDLFAHTFLKMHDKLLRAAGSLLHDSDEAADILQEVFCRLWPARKSVKSEDHASALAYTTVRNLSIDALRHRKSISSTDTAAAADVADTTGADLAEQQMRYKAVMRLVNERLSPLQRDILRLHDIEGQDTDRIARKLNMQAAAVRMNLSRARRTIKELYQKEYHE
jgi:RNA polymerase sigma factor (sigma-70 family)